MIDFPNQIPTDAIMLVIDKIRGRKDVNNREFAQALWNVVGYAASQALPEDKTIFEGREIGLEDFASLPRTGNGTKPVSRQSCDYWNHSLGINP